MEPAKEQAVPGAAAVSKRGTSDRALFEAAAKVIAIPRVEEADSFALHAPLEVLARQALLPMLAPDQREAARQRIAAVADSFQQWGTASGREPVHTGTLAGEAPEVLTDAIRRGDAEAADDAITWLTARLTTKELVEVLAGPVLPSLAAAGHGSILLNLLSTVAGQSLPAASMARTTVHELVRHPDWRLTWFEGLDWGQAPPMSSKPVRDQANLARELGSRLTAPKLSRAPGSDFIYPVMSTTEATGLAASTLTDLVPGVAVATARRLLLGVAAHSMLQDNTEAAPYGWSHCLTMPQAALGIAAALPNPPEAVAVAATYVLGFRASLGKIDLDLDFVPEPVHLAGGETDGAVGNSVVGDSVVGDSVVGNSVVGKSVVDIDEIVMAPPAVAAGAAWHASSADRPALVAQLASHAGVHHDAHLAKYTLACFDAARDNPDQAPLFLAAAAYLNAWWFQAGPSPVGGSVLTEREINAITFVVADMAQSVAFYQALGFAVSYGGPGAVFSTLDIGPNFVNLQHTGAPPGTGWGRVVFHVSNPDQVHQLATSAGYPTLTDPADAPWGERYFHIHDPDGHELSFARRL